MVWKLEVLPIQDQMIAKERRFSLLRLGRYLSTLNKYLPMSRNGIFFFTVSSGNVFIASQCQNSVNAANRVFP